MTFIGRYKQAPDYPYAEYDATGNDYVRDDKGDRRWSGIIEMLTELVGDDSRPIDELERAAEVLAFYAETVNEAENYPWPEGTPQVIIERDTQVAGMFARMFASHMWYDPDDCLFQDWPQSDNGSGYASFHPSRSVVSRRFHGPRVATVEPPPAPVLAPVFTPAVPLPVLQVSDVEKQAVKEFDLTFDEHYSPGAVTARVAAIEREAAQMRAMREQT